MTKRMRFNIEKEGEWFCLYIIERDYSSATPYKYYINGLSIVDHKGVTETRKLIYSHKSLEDVYNEANYQKQFYKNIHF